MTIISCNSQSHYSRSCSPEARSHTDPESLNTQKVVRALVANGSANSCLSDSHSRADSYSSLGCRIWSLVPNQNSEEFPCHTPDSSSCFGITSKLGKSLTQFNLAAHDALERTNSYYVLKNKIGPAEFLQILISSSQGLSPKEKQEFCSSIEACKDEMPLDLKEKEGYLTAIENFRNLVRHTEAEKLLNRLSAGELLEDADKIKLGDLFADVLQSKIQSHCDTADIVIRMLYESNLDTDLVKNSLNCRIRLIECSELIEKFDAGQLQETDQIRLGRLFGEIASLKIESYCNDVNKLMRHLNDSCNNRGLNINLICSAFNDWNNELILNKYSDALVIIKRIYGVGLSEISDQERLGELFADVLCSEMQPYCNHVGKLMHKLRMDFENINIINKCFENRMTLNEYMKALDIIDELNATGLLKESNQIKLGELFAEIIHSETKPYSSNAKKMIRHLSRSGLNMQIIFKSYNTTLKNT